MQYQPITRAEIDVLLSVDKGWKENAVPSADEEVRDWPIGETGYVIRVYTSVDVYTGTSRESGSDAIRVCVPKLIKSRRINRVPGWEVRLKTRIEEVLEEAKPMIQKRLQAQAKPKSTFSFPKIIALFETAMGEKLKYPKIRVTINGQDVSMHRAGQTAKVPGSITVTNGLRYGDPDSIYFGRIMPDGRWSPGTYAVKNVQASVERFLAALNQSPAEVAAEYGTRSGRCCFCNLQLTTDESLAAGYGPVCADHWGLPWGGKPGTLQIAADGETVATVQLQDPNFGEASA